MISKPEFFFFPSMEMDKYYEKLINIGIPNLPIICT